MRFTPQFLDELRARLPVSEVVGRRVKLKKAGREWKGLSPFQQEKSPSFTVNDQKGFYHDFSSGKHGDIISFLMETEGVDSSPAPLITACDTTRQAPLCPPLKVVNMGTMEAWNRARFKRVFSAWPFAACRSAAPH